MILTFEAEAEVEPEGIVAAVEVDDIETVVVVVAETDEQGAEAVTGGIVA